MALRLQVSALTKLGRSAMNRLASAVKLNLNLN